MTVTATNHRYRKFKSMVLNALCIACAILVILPLAVILFFLIKRGASSLNLAFFTGLPHAPDTPGAGMLNAIVGSVQVVLIASIMGVPIGVLGGIYLSEYGGEKLNRWIRFWADVLNGVPSIVWGMLAYALVVLHIGFGALAGGVALGFIMLPLVLRTTEEVLVLVPRSYREASLALGLPQWQTICRIVLPTAARGIITGILVAMGRVAGETAPLLFTAFGNNNLNLFHLTQPIGALPLQIYSYANSAPEDWHRQAWAGALVLVVLTFILSIGVRLFSRGRLKQNT